MSRRLVEKQGWADVVGQLDAWDKKNIEALVKTFCETKFTIPLDNGREVKTTGAEWIRSTVHEARQRHQLELGNDYGEKSKKLEMRVLTSVPRPLYMKLLNGYPALFKDYKQHLWFAKNFPMFRLPKKL